MNEYNLKVGDVLWRMHGHKKHRENETQWNAVPLCIEYADEHKFLDAYLCGGSWNSIGRTYFLTRAECLRNWDVHKDDHAKPAITSAMHHERERLGMIVKDDTCFWRDEDIFRVMVHEGLTGLRCIPMNELPWRKDKDPSEYGIFEEYITLGDIRETLGGRAIITVWHEGPLHGKIYETGNYLEETAWRLHGQTLGYV